MKIQSIIERNKAYIVLSHSIKKNISLVQPGSFNYDDVLINIDKKSKFSQMTYKEYLDMGRKILDDNPVLKCLCGHQNKHNQGAINTIRVLETYFDKTFDDQIIDEKTAINSSKDICKFSGYNKELGIAFNHHDGYSSDDKKCQKFCHDMAIIFLRVPVKKESIPEIANWIFDQLKYHGKLGDVTPKEAVKKVLFKHKCYTGTRLALACLCSKSIGGGDMLA